MIQKSFILSSDKSTSTKSQKNNIQAFKIRSVCRTAVHTVRRLYMTFADLRSASVRPAYSQKLRVCHVQISQKMQKSKTLYTLLLFCMPRTTSGSTSVLHVEMMIKRAALQSVCIFVSYVRLS